MHKITINGHSAILIYISITQEKLKLQGFINHHHPTDVPIQHWRFQTRACPGIGWVKFQSTVLIASRGNSAVI